MKNFLGGLAGGAVVILIAFFIGLVHNSLRANKLPLIPRPVSDPAEAASRPSPEKAAGDSSATGAPAEVEEVFDEPRGEVLGAITLEKAKALHEAGKAVFIDARSEKAFSEGHITGAINVPYDKLVEYYDMVIGTVPMDQLIVAYCWSVSCDFSDNLASELAMMGYTNVVVFKGGWEEWSAAGYPVEGTKVEKKE